MTDVTIAGLLRAGKERLGAPSAWTQGTMARDAAGAPCEPGSPNAVAWCAMGVVIALDRRRAHEAHDYLARVTPRAVPLPIYQDAPERTLAEVTKLFEEAAVAAERDEGVGDA